jgi:hypothetical protein
VTVTIPGGGSSITVKDEGSTLTSSPTSLDFVGGGVTATNSSGAVTVTIPTGGGRELLTSARTYYVRTDGSNLNDGLSNSSGGAFLTIQKAVDIASAIDNGGFDITIMVVAGTYTANTIIKSFVGAGRIIIRGATADMTSTVISTTSSDCFNNASGHYGVYHFEYLKIQTTTSGYGINFMGSGAFTWQNVAFGACVNSHITVSVGVFGKATGEYTINGGSTNHMSSFDGGQIRCQSVTVTVSGTPAFSDCFTSVGRVGTILANGITFSGSATGKRYDTSTNGVLYTGGGGANYFPGNSAGTTATGGVYV